MTKSEKFSRSPIAIAIVALWILNDLVLKQAFGNFWTGKISDITGLVAFPFFVCLILTKIFKSTKELKLFTISILLVHSVFAIINIRQDWNDLFHNILFSNHHGTADLEDIFCIPITIPILYFLFFKTERLIGIFPLKALFPVFCGFAFIATPAPQAPNFREFKIIYPKQSSLRFSGYEQTFIWYSMECNYSEFTIDIIENLNNFYDEYIWEIKNRMRPQPTVYSKENFEHLSKYIRPPIQIQLKSKDFFSIMDMRYKKKRFELNLKLNLEPGDYFWCMHSEEEYSSGCNIAYEERDLDSSYSREYNRKLIISQCNKILIR